MIYLVSAVHDGNTTVIGHVEYGGGDRVSFLVLTGVEKCDYGIRVLMRCVHMVKKSDEPLCIYTDIDKKIHVEDVYMVQCVDMNTDFDDALHDLRRKLWKRLGQYCRFNGGLLSLSD